MPTKGAIAMLERGRSVSENLQSLEALASQVASLRRENRFLRVGLVVCFVLASIPYLLGFQPETLTVKTVKTERIELLRDGKTRVAIVVHPTQDAIVVENSKGMPTVSLGHVLLGGGVGVYNNDGETVAGMSAEKDGGRLALFSHTGRLLWSAP